MMRSLPTQKILVTLDALLDTRIGTIAEFDQELAFHILTNENYHGREYDGFLSYPHNAFKARYKDRTEETLKHSTLTGMNFLLQHITNLISLDASKQPFHSGPEVIINFYPYQLDKEIEDRIKAAINMRMPLVPISSINLSDENLTTEYIKENITLFISYDITHWLELNLEKLIKNPLNDLTIYTPKIYHSDLSTTEKLKELEEAENNLGDPLDVLQLMLKRLFNFVMIDVKYFSIFHPEINLHLERFKYND